MIETANIVSMRPVAQAERIHILDILRGFAIFGILAVNIGGFASPAFFPGYVPPENLPWYDQLAKNLMLFLAEGKFYTIFAFLFGLGFSIQLARAEAKGRGIRSFYTRRMMVLLGLGILHAILLWYGDILRLYALLGLVLLAFRNRSHRTFVILAALFYFVSFIIMGLLGGPNGAEQEIPGWDVVGMARQVYTGSSIVAVVAFQSIIALPSFLIIAVWQGFTVMALFLLGLLAGRMKFFESLPGKRAALKRIAGAGLLFGLIGNGMFVFAENPWLSSLGLNLGAPALAACYIACLSLVSLTTSGAKVLAPIAKVGRMALSNYVIQSLICSILFNGYGFGLYEKVGATGLWGITFGIYLLQIPLSSWWLARFHYGPLEWVWRSLTYGQRQPFRARA